MLIQLLSGAWDPKAESCLDCSKPKPAKPWAISAKPQTPNPKPYT